MRQLDIMNFIESNKENLEHEYMGIMFIWLLYIP